MTVVCTFAIAGMFCALDSATETVLVLVLVISVSGFVLVNICLAFATPLEALLALDARGFGFVLDSPETTRSFAWIPLDIDRVTLWMTCGIVGDLRG